MQYISLHNKKPVIRFFIELFLYLESLERCHDT